MSNLTPEKRTDKNGNVVTRHVRDTSASEVGASRVRNLTAATKRGAPTFRVKTMKREKYMEKLALSRTRVTPDMTVADAKKIADAKKELTKFWHDAAISWMEKNVWGKSYKEFEQGWASVRISTTLNPGGTLTVEEVSHDQYSTRGAGSHLINKSELLT